MTSIFPARRRGTATPFSVANASDTPIPGFDAELTAKMCEVLDAQEARRARRLAKWGPVRLAALERAVEDTQTLWGSSRWACWRRCPREHHLGYDVGLERLGSSIRPAHFAVGSLCHAILRYVQDGVVAGEATPREWRDVLEYASDDPDSAPEVLDEVARLMEWYWERWGLENAGWPLEARIAGVEIHLETPPGFAALPHTGRVDTLLEIEQTLYIVDTKTRARSFPSDLDDYIRSATTRAQFLSLSAMLQMAHGLDEPPHVLVNGIVKLKSMPKYERVHVPIEQWQIDAWKVDHQAQADELAEQLNTKDGTVDAWRRNLDACAPEIGSNCRFFGYCHAKSDEQRALNWTAKGPRT